ncbi:MAG: glycosyltransferase [Caldilineaceae bacterium]|nr:glycosyltransferase [Caldilineaceae bacterium]
MYAVIATILQFLYITCMVGLAVYGFHALWLTWQTIRHARPQPVPVMPSQWPLVTVQLPIYNEQHVAQRIIDACAQLDYPADRLEIQVLDDSDDRTCGLVSRRVDFWQERGVDIKLVTRPERRGFKAGALAYALPHAQGDFIAIFDADFLPRPDFLHTVMPYFTDDHNPHRGFVQTRWSHLNRGYSLLTRSQALALDGHFVVEQQGRQAAGFLFGFNGSGGVWRRVCIEDPAVGGWQDDTLCEDLDLSYRAQLAGWQGCYINDLDAPAEIPPTLTAFKRQQFRWAKGSIQTLRKLGGRVWRSDRPLVTRLFGLFHLGNYLLHPLLLTLLLSALPLMLLGWNPAAPLALLSLTALGPPLLYTVAQRRLHPTSWRANLLNLPLLMLLGTGIALSNGRAVLQGLHGQGGDFLRTPKFRVESAQDRWQNSAYHLRVDALFFGELLFMLYALATAGVAAYMGRWWSMPFFLLYAAGFGLMVGLSVIQGIQARGGWKWQPRRENSVDYHSDQLGA